MGGGSLDKYHENMGMESNSVPTSSGQCGGDDSTSTAGDSILQQLMQLCLSDINSTSLDSSSGHANGGADWQEEVYQRIETMKETYLPELDQLYQKIVTKLQQLESLPQQPKSDQLEKLKILKTMLERNISFLQVSKTNILPTAAPLQQHQSQISQVQSHENPMHMQSMNMQGSVPIMKQNNMSNMAQNNMSNMAQNNMSRAQYYMSRAQNNMSRAHMAQINFPSMAQNNLSRAQNYISSMAQNNMSSKAQNNMSIIQKNMSSMQLNPLPSQFSAAQVNAALNSLQELPPVGSMQQNPARTSQQGTSQNEVNMLLHPNNPLHTNGDMLQHQQELMQELQVQHHQLTQKLHQMRLQWNSQNPVPQDTKLTAPHHLLVLSTKRSREQELVEEVKKQKVEIEELKQRLVQMQQQVQQQQVKEEKE